MFADAPLDSIAHIIQTALTPVFLLTGIATLLNLLSTRLGRVNDLMRQVAALLAEGPPPAEEARTLRRRLARLRRRSASVLFTLLGLAVVCTTGSLLAFLVETLLF